MNNLSTDGFDSNKFITKLLHVYYNRFGCPEINGREKNIFIFPLTRTFFTLKQMYPREFSWLSFAGHGWHSQTNNIYDVFSEINKKYDDLVITPHIYADAMSFQPTHESQIRTCEFSSHEESILINKIANIMYQISVDHSCEHSISEILRFALSDSLVAIKYLEDVCYYLSVRNDKTNRSIYDESILNFNGYFDTENDGDLYLCLHSSLPGLSSLSSPQFCNDCDDKTYILLTYNLTEDRDYFDVYFPISNVYEKFMKMVYYHAKEL